MHPASALYLLGHVATGQQRPLPVGANMAILYSWRHRPRHVTRGQSASVAAATSTATDKRGEQLYMCVCGGGEVSGERGSLSCKEDRFAAMMVAEGHC